MFLFDELDIKAMEDIIDTQFALIELSRQKKRKEENQILILIDDFSSEPEMTRSNRLVSKLFTRGRHARISTVCSVHRTKNVLNPIIRAQATALFMFRQKAFLELQAFLEENSATVGKDVLEKVYRLAVSQPVQVLYVNLKTLDINEMFFVGFQQRIRVTEQKGASPGCSLPPLWGGATISQERPMGDVVSLVPSERFQDLQQVRFPPWVMGCFWRVWSDCPCALEGPRSGLRWS